jgi:hypothetical protein
MLENDEKSVEIKTKIKYDCKIIVNNEWIVLLEMVGVLNPHFIHKL